MNTKNYIVPFLLALAIVSCRQKGGPGGAGSERINPDSSDHAKIEQVRNAHLTKEEILDFTFDSTGRKVDSSNTQVTYTVLESGLVRRTRSIEQHWTTNLDTTIYDKFDRPIHTANINGYSWTTTIYDDEQHLVLDSLNVGGKLRIKIWQFDPEGRLLSVNGGPDGVSIHRTYDEKGHLVSEVDSSHGKLSSTRMITLDSLGRERRSIEMIVGYGPKLPSGEVKPTEGLITVYHDPTHHQRFDTVMTQAANGGWSLNDATLYFVDSAAHVQEIRRQSAADGKLLRYTFDTKHELLKIETEHGLQMEAKEELDSHGLVTRREEFGPEHHIQHRVEHRYTFAQ